MPSQAFLRTSRALWKRRVAYRTRKLAEARRAAHAKPGSTVTHAEAERVHKWERLLASAKRALAARERQLAETRPLRLRALAEMKRLVGIVEVGGNNSGAQVLAIIHANGGPGPEPWCGDTVAFAYRKAGSKVVQRGWAAVRLLGFLTGMQIVREPKPGDIVAYTFSHTGLFKRWLDRSAGTFEAIEGNTGASGAVSDSSDGRDGVRLKIRDRSQVARWVRVTR